MFLDSVVADKILKQLCLNHEIIQYLVNSNMTNFVVHSSISLIQ